MVNTSTLPVDRAVWLSERRNGVGASDVAGILNVSPWASPWSVWASKVGLPVPDVDTAPMAFGRDVEPLIAAWFERETGLRVAGRQHMVRHPEHPWRFATLDGFVTDGGAPWEDDPQLALGVFESKFTGAETWGAVPEHVRAQVAWQMHVTDLPHVWVVALSMPFGRPTWRMFVVDRDEIYERQILHAVEGFWFDHVVTGVMPDPDAHVATHDAVRAAWPERVPEPVVDVGELADLLREIGRRRADIKRMQDQCDADTTLVLAKLGKFANGVVNDAPACRVTMITQTRIDADAVRRDHGDKYDKKSRPSPRLYLLGEFKR